jgi:type IV secretory pathway TraG/TraD family ATPase VirD4
MLNEFLHGWSGIALAYGAVQLPMWTGLSRAGAAARHYLASPVVAATLTGLTAAGTSLALGWLPTAARVAVGLAVSAAVGYATGKEMARQDGAAKQYQRGAVLEPGRSPPRTRSSGRQLTLAGLEVSSQDETKHFKFIGTTGTGKSTAIEEMLEGALARGDRAVIADPDGGYLRRFGAPSRGDVVLNPFHGQSRKWDIFGEIENAYDIEQLARSLIPDHEGADRSWRAYARTFFTAVTRQARDAGVDDVGELYRLLVVSEAEELRTLVKGTPAQPFLDEANSRMFDSIRSVTSASVGSLEHVAQQKAAPLSVRSWVRGGEGGVLFMPYRANQIAALGSTVAAWMRLAIFETMSGEESFGTRPRRLWFVVDELDALGQIDGLKDALARLRKFGGRCVLGFQSIAQVSSTYGRGDAHTIVENCGNTMILRCSASEGGGTARFASQLIGEREVLRQSESRTRRTGEWFGSVTRSESFGVESVLLPSEVEQLPDLAGYLKYASQSAWRRVELNPRTKPESLGFE